MPFQTGGAGAGVTTLSDLEIDTDKDWKAYGIYNLGDLTPKVDGAYNLGSPNIQFDNAYANNVPPIVTEPVSNAAGDLDSVRDVGSGALSLENLLASPDAANVVDNTNLAVSKAADIIYQSELSASKAASIFDHANLGVPRAADIAYNSNLQLVKEASIFDHANLGASKAADIAYDTTMVVSHDASLFDHANLSSPKAADITYQTEMKVEKAASIFNHGNLAVTNAADITYQSELQPVKAASIFDHANLTVSRAADIAYQTELQPVKFADVFDHANLSSARAKDTVYHANFNLPSAEARDKVAESTYGMAGDLVGVKGISKQVTEKKDFAFRTETPNHAYWHHMWNTPAAFAPVYQDYTTSMQHKGTTPSMSAPNTADPNPQPGAMWSVHAPVDGAVISSFVAPGSDPRGFTFDGQYLWHGDYGSNTVYKLKKDGTVLTSFAGPGGGCTGASWDGEYLWINDYTSNTTYQVTTAGGVVTKWNTGFRPCGLSWDGEYLWISAAGTATGYVYKYTPGGTQKDSFTEPGGRPTSCQQDGVYFFVFDGDADVCYVTDETGAEIRSFTEPFTTHGNLGWDGVYMWHGNAATGRWCYQIGPTNSADINYRIFAK